jgi:hypothetical protein
MSRGKCPIGIEKGTYGSRLSDAKRERPARYQPSKLPNIDVHGILFAIVAVVFVLGHNSMETMSTAARQDMLVGALEGFLEDLPSS